MNVTRIDTGSHSCYSTSIKAKPDRVGTVVQKDIVAISTLLSLLSLYTFLYFHSYSSPGGEHRNFNPEVGFLS